jgi:hypothetical protein
MLRRAARPARQGSTRIAVSAILAGLLGSLALLVPAASPASAMSVRVDHRLFGLHDGSMTSLKSSGVGSLRLWDVGVTWREIQSTDPATGTPVYDWTRLDRLVSAARAKHVEVTLVLGMTPGTYSPDPAVVPFAATANGADNPAVTAYRTYVNAVMQRYGSRIAAYQVWNEANVVDYWKGTPAQMAQLTKIVYTARNKYARRSKVVSAAMTTRLNGQRRWIKQFAATKVAGTPVYHFLDAVALNLYPLAKYGSRAGVPEDAMTLLAKSRAILADHHWPSSLPIWNTEVNYGLQTGSAHHKAVAIPGALQAANVIRTYVLNAANGVQRVFWYRWDLAALARGGALGNTLLTKPGHPSSLTPAGKAFELVQTWLHGTLVGPSKKALPCRKDGHGTYTCEVRYSSGVGRIYWNPKHAAKVTLAESATKVQDEFGRTSRVKGGSTHTVNAEPILVRSHS